MDAYIEQYGESPSQYEGNSQSVELSAECADE